MAHKFHLMMRGENFAIETDGKIKRLSFFQNLFIEAENNESAEEKAIQLIRSDQSLRDAVRNSQDDPPRLFVEELHELDSFDDIEHKDQGRIFYNDDET